MSKQCSRHFKKGVKAEEVSRFVLFFKFHHAHVENFTDSLRNQYPQPTRDYISQSGFTIQIEYATFFYTFSNFTNLRYESF